MAELQKELLLFMSHTVPATVPPKQTTPNLTVSKPYWFYRLFSSRAGLSEAPCFCSMWHWDEFRAGGLESSGPCSPTCLASGLRGPKQLWIGAAAHPCIGSLCLVSPAWWLLLHKVALGSRVLCPWGVGGRSPERWHSFSSDPVLKSCSFLFFKFFQNFLLVETVAMAHQV